MVELIFHRLRLALPNPGQPYRLYPDFDQAVSLAALTQGEGPEERPIIFIGRRATKKECRMTPVERTLYTVHWALHKLRRYTTFAVQITVVVPDVEVAYWLKVGNVHLNALGYLADIGMYKVRWTQGPTLVAFALDWMDTDAMCEPLERPDTPRWEHQDVCWERLEHKESAPAWQSGTECYFDGGARRHEGSGGFWVWDKERLLVARAIWYGVSKPTNNSAEMQALVDCTEWLVETGVARHVVNMHGDSKLMIDFCTRRARPGQAELFTAYRRL